MSKELWRKTTVPVLHWTLRSYQEIQYGFFFTISFVTWLADESRWLHVYKHRQKTERGRRSEARWGKNINKKTKKNYDFAWLSVFLAFSRGCVANKRKDGPDFVGWTWWEKCEWSHFSLKVGNVLRLPVLWAGTDFISKNSTIRGTRGIYLQTSLTVDL